MTSINMASTVSLYVLAVLQVRSCRTVTFDGSRTPYSTKRQPTEKNGVQYALFFVGDCTVRVIFSFCASVSKKIPKGNILLEIGRAHV